MHRSNKLELPSSSLAETDLRDIGVSGLDPPDLFEFEDSLLDPLLDRLLDLERDAPLDLLLDFDRDPLLDLLLDFERDTLLQIKNWIKNILMMNTDIL